jgi:murein DD-endopeptidase MepM/ murein hydrolase activator NlpD
MFRSAGLALLCTFSLNASLRAQEVYIAREEKPAVIPKVEKAAPPVIPVAKAIAATDGALKAEPVATKPTSSPAPKPSTSASPPISTDLSPLKKPAKPQIAAAHPNAPAPLNVRSTSSKIDNDTLPFFDRKFGAAAVATRSEPTHSEPTHNETARAEPPRTEPRSSAPRVSLAAAPQPISFSGDNAFIKLADGFDFPVGKPEAQGYYKARGFRSHGHLGEDWDGTGGGDTDLGDSIYAIGDGVVVFARDCHMGWGNVVIVRHSYRENGSVRTIDSLYGHLQSMLVKRGQSVSRGQKIATMGTAHGLYDAHLHLEIRKNLEIGMSRAAFARDFSNYYDPSQFIAAHRHLSSNGGTYRVAMNTFTHDARINWDKARNFSHAHTGGGSSESAAALKRAVAAKK